MVGVRPVMEQIMNHIRSAIMAAVMATTLPAIGLEPLSASSIRRSGDVETTAIISLQNTFDGQPWVNGLW